MAPVVRTPVRVAVRVEGIVQGVGFRPFVYSLATGLGLGGLVGNDVDGVFAEVEGPPGTVREFLRVLETDPPPLARIERITTTDMAPLGVAAFRIVASGPDGRRRTLGGRGPRHLRRLPAGTLRPCRPPVPLSLHQLHQLRPALHHRHGHPVRPADYDDEGFSDVRAVQPGIRRSGRPAVPCSAGCVPGCGPGCRSGTRPDGLAAPDPIRETAARLKRGEILAIKGLGGFHLACDATNEETVRELRRRKHARRNRSR